MPLDMDIHDRVDGLIAEAATGLPGIQANSCSARVEIPMPEESCVCLDLDALAELAKARRIFGLDT